MEELIDKLNIKIYEAQEYLKSTDYKVLKWAEGVESEDPKIKLKRQEARNTINYCLDKLDELSNEELI